MTKKDDFARILEALNSAFQADPAAVHCLCANRVPCNQTLADHPTVQVGAIPVWSDAHQVGALGLLNGVIEALTGRRVATQWSDDKPQPKMLGFIEWSGDGS